MTAPRIDVQAPRVCATKPDRVPESWSPQTKLSQKISDEMFTLAAEDIRDARNRLGVSVELAAASACLEPCVYRAIEEGTTSANATNWNRMWLAARRLGLKELRISHVEEFDDYMKLDISRRVPTTIFVDTWDVDIKRLRKEHVWVNPSQVLALLECRDLIKTLRSRQSVDKQLIELWIAAVFSLSCDSSWAYYVRLAESDPPDAEVLAIGAAGEVNQFEIEITQHGPHSPGLAELLRKKLRTRLPAGTIIVVFVEQAERIWFSDLRRVVERDNPHSHSICIIGPSQEPNRFTYLVYLNDEMSDPEEKGLLVRDCDERDASRGFRGYEGIMYYSRKNRSARPNPVFVKNLVLDG